MTFRYAGPPSMALYPLQEEPEKEAKASLGAVVDQLVAMVDDALPAADAAPQSPPRRADAHGPAVGPVDGPVPALRKADEDALLRPARDGEMACISGEHCECMQMARFPPHNDAEEGFHGVAVRNGYCLLCLRVAIAKAYYVSAMTGSDEPQLLRNRIEEPGEYCRDACFLPCAANNFLTDPVVMHQRNAS